MLQLDPWSSRGHRFHVAWGLFGLPPYFIFRGPGLKFYIFTLKYSCIKSRAAKRQVRHGIPVPLALHSRSNLIFLPNSINFFCSTLVKTSSLVFINLSYYILDPLSSLNSLKISTKGNSIIHAAIIQIVSSFFFIIFKTISTAWLLI